MRTIIYMYTYTRRARIILINIWGGGASKKILTFTSIYYMPPPPFPRKQNWGSTNSIKIQFGEMHKIYLHIYTRIV